MQRNRNLRAIATLAHRYVGLVIAGFLIIAGLTGALLAWNNELDAAISPELFRVTRPSPTVATLDPLSLRQQVQARYPDAFVAMVPLILDADSAVVIRLFALPDPTTGIEPELPNDQVFVNPYTGQVLGERKWGDISQGIKNLMPFIYRLHFTLALDALGSYVLGIVALLWTLDCFVGTYLTFPARRKMLVTSNLPSPMEKSSNHSWFSRWRRSWKVRWGQGRHKVNFDLHRAGGLWPWAMLFVVAWSSVAFNLTEVYEPVMRSMFAHQTTIETIPRQSQPVLTPELNWQEARVTARRLMAQQAREKGFAVLRETTLIYDPLRGIYRYHVESSRDIRDHGGGSTSIIFDATTGAFKSLWLPTGAASGDTIRTWITSLHLAALWGIPMKLFVCVTGLVVAMLSITGIVIWIRKRSARAAFLDGRPYSKALLAGRKLGGHR